MECHVYRAAVLGSMASFVLLLASATPGHASPFDEGACTYTGPSFGRSGRGTIVEFVSPERAAQIMQFSQVRARATLNPKFVSNTRVKLTLPNGERKLALLPDWMVAKPGDEVVFVGGHRDWSLPCGYIPNLVTNFVHPHKATR